MAGRHTAPLILRVRNVTKRYLGMTVFDDLSVDITTGFTALLGPSGSGKTTLLNLMMGIDRPDAGQIVVDGVDITGLSDAQRTRWRAGTGQIFQRSGLVAGLTTMQNILDPHVLAGHRVDHEWVAFLLQRLNMSQKASDRAGRLSGGEQQRVAMVRSLAHRPHIVFADEPTANLDTRMKEEAHRFLADVSREVPVVVVSHDAMTRDYADHVVFMRDGRIPDDSAPAARSPADGVGVRPMQPGLVTGIGPAVGGRNMQGAMRNRRRQGGDEVT